MIDMDPFSFIIGLFSGAVVVICFCIRLSLDLELHESIVCNLKTQLAENKLVIETQQEAIRTLTYRR